MLQREQRAIVDTGPLVALLCADDRMHAWARECFASVRAPLATCEAVLAECSHLLRRLKGGQHALLSLVTEGLLSVDFALASEAAPVRALMERYASLPMSLADACLVRMAELAPRCPIITFDRDFNVYRRKGREALTLIAPS